MTNAEAVKAFKEALKFMGSGYADKALPLLTKACELDTRNPFYMSYLGLALGVAEEKWEKAEDICMQAVKLKRTQPELYLNLAEIYRLQEKKEDAIDTLKIGLSLTRQDPRLKKALTRYGIRRGPVLSFLDRKHFLNVQLGKIRYKMLKTLGKES